MTSEQYQRLRNDPRVRGRKSVKIFLKHLLSLKQRNEYEVLHDVIEM